MKNRMISILILILFLLANVADGQTTSKKLPAKSKSAKSKSAQAHKVKPASVPVTVKLTNKCEKELMIYAGPKSNLRDPKQRQVGGLSTNMLYLKTGDVVCIMDAKKKPFACVNITKATTRLEINLSGTVISASQ
jgi:hypothetical protein